MQSPRFLVSFSVVSTLSGLTLLAACGGGDDGGGGSTTEPPDAAVNAADASAPKPDAANGTDGSKPAATFTVGGTVKGLEGTGLTLKNGVDVVTVAPADAGAVSFTFPTKVASGAAYAVSVGTQPEGPFQTCAVTGGNGTVASADVSSVVVDCTTNKKTVGGTISGLAGTIVLQNNGGDDLSVSTNGPFTFQTAIESGDPYAVTVKTQPAHHLCAVTNGSGTIANANVTNVAVACKHRDAITVASTDAAALTGFQVRVKLSTASFAYAAAKANGDDLRFSTDGTTIDVPYWIESWDPTGDSYVWLKVPSIPANGSTKVYVLYGDPAAAKASNGDATFELFDDFEDGVYTDKWDVYGTPATLTESGGELHVVGNSNWEHVAAKKSFDYPVVMFVDQRTVGTSTSLVLADSASRNRYGWYGGNGPTQTFVDTDVNGGASAYDSFPNVTWSGGSWKIEVAAGLSGANIAVKSWCNLTASACNTAGIQLPVAGITAFVPGFTSWSSGHEIYVGLFHVRKYSAATVTATLD